MKERYIEFAQNKQTEEYLEQIFEKCNISYSHETEFGRTVFKFFATKQVHDGIISGIILNFYKLRELTKFLGKNKKDKPYYALLGALLGLEKEEESDSVIKAVSEEEVSNVDGLYNFRLEELRESWINLAKLSAKLYAQCRNDEDVYALSIFMLGMDENISSTVVIGSGEELYWEKNGTKIAVIPYFGEKEADLIVTLLSQRPSDVVVVDPTDVPKGVLEVIRALGE